LRDLDQGFVAASRGIDFVTLAAQTSRYSAQQVRLVVNNE
jgi:hypothetical protein